MPLGIVSDSDLSNELENCSTQISRTVDIIPVTGSIQPADKYEYPVGRGSNNLEVPNSLRQIIGETSITEGRASALGLARDFGISPSSVSAYAKGATSTATIGDTPNSAIIKKAKLNISVKARKRLNLALNQITEEKLSEAKLSEISSIAKDMSVVMKNMEDKNDSDSNKRTDGPSIVLYAPQIRQENHYTTVQTNE